MSRRLLLSLSSLVHSCYGEKDPRKGRWVWFSETTPRELEELSQRYQLILPDNEVTREMQEELPIFSLEDRPVGTEKAISLTPNPPPREREEKELVLMVGQQGSGKSTAARQLGYPIISEEQFNYRKKPFFAALENLLSQGSVTVDGTNASRKKRQPIIDFAHEKGVPVRILWATLPGHERNKLREDRVPGIALVQYQRNFEPPLWEAETLELVN